VSEIIAVLLAIIIKINLSLAIFNLLPIPPLDGSKIFALILPPRLAETYLSLSSFGTLLLLLLLVFPVGGFSLMSVVSSIFIYSLKLLGLS
jgi:Zn-dependent protease